MDIDKTVLLATYSNEELAEIIIKKDNELQMCKTNKTQLEKTLSEELIKYKNLEKEMYPLTLKKLVGITLEQADKTEGKKASHIHLLSDEESYKWEKLLDFENETRMPLDVLFKKYQLYQQAFYLACWGLAEYDDKGWHDEMEASDEWKEIIMKEAEKKLEVMKNEKSI